MADERDWKHFAKMAKENLNTEKLKNNNMNKTMKALLIVFLGLIIWTGLAYIALAFLKAEANPFVWSEGERFGMLFLIFCYVVFSPLMVIILKDEL